MARKGSFRNHYKDVGFARGRLTGMSAAKTIAELREMGEHVVEAAKVELKKGANFAIQSRRKRTKTAQSIGCRQTRRPRARNHRRADFITARRLSFLRESTSRLCILRLMHTVKKFGTTLPTRLNERRRKAVDRGNLRT